ncbi:ABC transporter ATP-binding protein [Cumulibacter soli]|uniref:ABC transporter ATP-binding protein n=1 Tax=Cumulibacter soli TaxID=2546344 RepID=UPI0010687946|nr:ABC transporter ATP-binding protein [Cumulibacter soli]
MTTTPLSAQALGIRCDGLRLGYGSRVVSDGLQVHIPEGKLTAIVGPNACGKSTLLRAMVRLLPPDAGVVEIRGRDAASIKHKEFARLVGFLPQEAIAPEGITVERLVARGRFPHQSLLSAWSVQDQRAVEEAMALAGVTELAERHLSALSGGQRQRVWIAMVLAQQTDFLLLDEPTTFLDITHQYDLLRLLERLRNEGRTVVAVLHDINQACRFADHLIAMRDGEIRAQGRPGDILDADLMQSVFDLACQVIPDPVTGTPMVVPNR